VTLKLKESVAFGFKLFYFYEINKNIYYLPVQTSHVIKYGKVVHGKKKIIT